MINLLCINTLKVIFNYFGDVRVFLKTTGDRKGTMNREQYFKGKTYQALDTGYLPH